MRGHRRAGFTFVEMMVVAGLFSIVGVALFTSFSMGLKVWKSATTPNLGYRKALIALDRCAAELRQLRPYASILSGEVRNCSFPLLAHGRIENVTYAFDADAGTFSREAVLFEDDMEAGLVKPYRRVLVTGVKEGTFSYFGLENMTAGATPNGTFFESWNAPNGTFPKAVRIAMEMEDGTLVEKTVVIPSEL